MLTASMQAFPIGFPVVRAGKDGQPRLCSLSGHVPGVIQTAPLPPASVHLRGIRIARLETDELETVMAKDMNSIARGAERSLSAADAARAISLCSKGAIDEGIALYRQVLKARNERAEGPKLPVGLHLQYLEQLGLEQVAQVIRLEGLRTGQNLNARYALGKSPGAVVAEYRELFARDLVNSTMVADFLVQLSKLGNTAEMKPYLDADHLVRRTILSIDDGENFWRRLAAMLLHHQTDANFRPAAQSVRSMHQISIATLADSGLQRLLIELEQEVRHYVADLRAGGRSPTGWIPQRFSIDPWALISTGHGYNTPHIHPKGWLSGVVYVSGPDEIGDDGYPIGALRIGPPTAVESPEAWPKLAVAPRPGTLILFPSYFSHWTLPIGKPELRINCVRCDRFSLSVNSRGCRASLETGRASVAQRRPSDNT